VTVANFLTSVTQSGYLSHAATLAAYKELSLQIGTGSHIMASLPVLMSMIFALGETSALVSVANDVRPRDSSIGEQVTPQPIGAAPLLRQNSMASIEQGIGGGFQRITQTGAIDAIASSATFGSQTREAGQSVSAAITRQHTVSEATSDAVRWQQAFSRRDYSSLGIDNSTGESIRHGYESALREGNRDANGSSTASTRNNVNTTSANAGGSVGLKIGGGGIGFETGASTNTSATDQMIRTRQSSHDDSVEQSKALSRSLNEELTRRKSTGSGNSNDRVLSKSLDTQRNYQDIVSQSGSSTDQTSQALRDSSSFIANSQRIGTAAIADQVATNRDYAMYQVLAGRDFDAQAGSQSYREVAERDMDSGATDRLQGNPAARDAAVRHRAAVLMSQDERASPEARLASLEYLTGSAMAMQHLGFRPFQTKMRSLDIADPSNRTGVNGARVMSGGDQVERAGVHSNVMLPQTNFGSSAADADLRTMHADGTTVKAERERQDLVADNADLGNYGSGTAKRTLVNTAANIAGTDAGAPSRVGVGRPGASPASAVERPRGPRPPAADPAAPAAGAPSGGGQP
jgi:conjugal transfer mating pair stabilization protein TraG